MDSQEWLAEAEVQIRLLGKMIRDGRSTSKTLELKAIEVRHAILGAMGYPWGYGLPDSFPIWNPDKLKK